MGRVRSTPYSEGVRAAKDRVHEDINPYPRYSDGNSDGMSRTEWFTGYYDYQIGSGDYLKRARGELKI